MKEYNMNIDKITDINTEKGCLLSCKCSPLRNKLLRNGD